MKLRIFELRNLVVESLSYPKTVRWNGPNGWVVVPYVRPAGVPGRAFDSNVNYHFIVRPGTDEEYPVHKSTIEFAPDQIDVVKPALQVSQTLAQRYADRLPGGIGKMIGKGMDGEVYEFGSNKVIKLGRDKSEFVDRVENVVSQLKNDRDFAPVLDFGRRDAGDETIYWIVMSKLNPLASDEREMVQEFFGDFTAGFEVNQRQMKRLQQTFMGHEKLLDFMKRIVSRLSDRTNPDNVMKTSDGEYKIIDPEGLEAMWK